MGGESTSVITQNVQIVQLLIPFNRNKRFPDKALESFNFSFGFICLSIRYSSKEKRHRCMWAIEYARCKLLSLKIAFYRHHTERSLNAEPLK